MTQVIDDSAESDLLAQRRRLQVRRRRGMAFLALAVAGVGFAMVVQMGLNANYLADDIGLSGFQLGLLEAIRESCGIIAFGVLALLAGFAEPVVAAAMLALVAVGLGGYAVTPTFGWVVLASLVWSQGLHVWMPLPNSMALALAEPGRAGRRLGQLRAAGAVGSLAGLGLALALTSLAVPIRPLYLLAAGAALLAGTVCLAVPRNIKTPGPRFVLRRRYGLFYLLSFLEGWRKQIFLCFAGFLLVRVHGTPVRTMLVLWIAINAIRFAAAPAAGRLIDRLGERRVLMFYFGCLTAFFVGYAFIPNRYVLYALFVVDSAFFVFATALLTYVGRIAPPGEHTPTLSVGIAMNHIAAVTMPLVGGLLWKFLGYQWTFLVGAGAAAVSVLAASRIGRRAVSA